LFEGTTARRYRPLGGAACGVLIWIVCRSAPAQLAGAVTFYITALALVFGAGALTLLPVERELDARERIALSCAIGVAVAPFAMCVLAVCRVPFVFPPLAFALSGAMAARDATVRRTDDRGAGAWWCLVAAAIVFAIATWISTGRITSTADRVAIFGDYETFDLTYYASIASELAHTTTIPPVSPFYAGHRIIYSYFSLMLLAGVHTVTGVSMLDTFLAYGWPLYTSVAAGAVFTFCRRLGSTPFAFVSTVLVFTGSSLAYIGAWLTPEIIHYDPLIWSSLFLAPSGEWIYFNPWAPALAVTCAGLFALTRIDGPERAWWMAIASFCFGALFMFKSFSFPVVVAALAAAATIRFARRDRSAVRLAIVVAASIAWALPWLLAVLPFNQAENRGAQVRVEWLWLVRRMLIKADLTGSIERMLQATIGLEPNAIAILTVASVVFLVGGLSIRLLGGAALVRAALGTDAMRDWTPLAWIVIIGIGLSFAITIAPFPNSIQTYLFALYAMWPFAVLVVWPAGAKASPLRWGMTAAIVAASIPSTFHYAGAAHAAAAGAPITTLDDGDARIIRYLRRTDENTTLMLHSNPVWPSLYVIEAQRRAVLAWSSYVEGDGNPEIDALLADIARFFGTADAAGADDLSLVRRFHVTHVIERVGRDRLHPHVVERLRLVTGTPDVRLYEVPAELAP
jgi:hypothetical protein